MFLSLVLPPRFFILNRGKPTRKEEAAKFQQALFREAGLPATPTYSKQKPFGTVALAGSRLCADCLKHVPRTLCAKDDKSAFLDVHNVCKRGFRCWMDCVIMVTVSIYLAPHFSMRPMPGV